MVIGITRHESLFFPIFEYSVNLNSFIMDNDQEKKLELSNEGVYHLTIIGLGIFFLIGLAAGLTAVFH